MEHPDPPEYLVLLELPELPVQLDKQLMPRQPNQLSDLLVLLVLLVFPDQLDLPVHLAHPVLMEDLDQLVPPVQLALLDPQVPLDLLDSMDKDKEPPVPLVYPVPPAKTDSPELLVKTDSMAPPDQVVLPEHLVAPVVQDLRVMLELQDFQEHQEAPDLLDPLEESDLLATLAVPAQLDLLEPLVPPELKSLLQLLALLVSTVPLVKMV